MAWFGRNEGTTESVALALAVGELKGQVAAMQREIDRLKAPVAPGSSDAPALSPRITATIHAMAQGHGDLLRHMEGQARAMLADQIDEADIIAAIRRGS